jgi:hypothetical protein
MERIMSAISWDVKDAKEVKEEANEIIKEIARKAEAPWETEYSEDKNDRWDYKIGYCSMINGVCVEERCWPYRGYTIEWIEDIRMLFWRLKHPDTWWCDFDRTFEEINEEEKRVSEIEDEEKRTKETEAFNIHRKNIGEKFEEVLSERKEKLEQAKNECREIIQYIHYQIDPSIECYMKNSEKPIDEDVKYFSWTESARLILKLRKEMMDEEMQEAESSISDYFEEKRAIDEYEKWICEEGKRTVKSLNFTKNHEPLHET